MGYIPESDIFKIKSQLANEQLTLTNNINQLSINELDLKQLINIPFSVEITLKPIEENLFSKLNIDKNDESTINTALEQNPAYQ